MDYPGNKKSLVFKDCFWICSRNLLKYQMQNVHSDHTFYSFNWNDRRQHNCQQYIFILHLQKTSPLETSLTIWRAVYLTKTSVPLKPSPRRQCLPQDLSMRPMPPRSLQAKGQGHPHYLVWPSPRQTWWVHKYLFPKFLKICKPWWFIKDFPSYLVIFYTFWA